MAWATTTINGLAVHSETTTLPSSATTEYGSVVTRFKPNGSGTTHYVTFECVASAVSGTNIDVGLYGSDTGVTASSVYLLKDAIVTDLATGALTAAGAVDLNAYPAPYYFIGWTSDANESANTITTKIIAVKEG